MNTKRTISASVALILAVALPTVSKAAVTCTGNGQWGTSIVELESLVPGVPNGSSIYVRTSGGSHGRYPGTYGLDGSLTFSGPTGNYVTAVHPDRLYGSFRTTETRNGATADGFTWMCQGSTASVVQQATPAAVQRR